MTSSCILFSSHRGLLKPIQETVWDVPTETSVYPSIQTCEQIISNCDLPVNSLAQNMNKG